MNDIRKNDNSADIEKPMGSDDASPSTGLYVLETGEKLNEELKDATKVVFTWEKAPDGMQTKDVSENQNGSILLWEDNKTVYISSQRAGQVIYFNAVSSKMFLNCTSLEEIQFDNVDTSNVVDMSEMFAACTELKELDLSSFNTSNVEDTSKLFYGCSQLKTAYTQDQKLQLTDDYVAPKVRRLQRSLKRLYVK